MRTPMMISAALALAPLWGCPSSPPDDPAVTLPVPMSYSITAGGGPTGSATQAITAWVGAPAGMGATSSASASILAGPVCPP